MNWTLVAVFLLVAPLAAYTLYLLLDMWMQHLLFQQAIKESETEPSDDLVVDDGEDEPAPTVWTADCSCGWKAPVGSSRGHYLATSAAKAEPLLHAFHDRQLKTIAPAPLKDNTEHQLTVFPYTQTG